MSCRVLPDRNTVGVWEIDDYFLLVPVTLTVLVPFTSLKAPVYVKLHLTFAKMPEPPVHVPLPLVGCGVPVERPDGPMTIVALVLMEPRAKYSTLAVQGRWWDQGASGLLTPCSPDSLASTKSRPAWSVV